MATTPARTETLDLHLHQQTKQEPTSAMTTSHHSITNFGLESALSHDDPASDRQQFGITAERWHDFMAALDSPQRTLPRIKTLFETPGIFTGKR